VKLLLRHWRLRQQQASCQTGGTFLLLVSQPLLGSEEKTALCEVVDSGWITMGEKVREFEAAFAALHEAEDSVAVASCTAALHLILHALNIGPGDEVLVPSLTFVATANCVLYVGADPVFVDIESVDVPLLSLEDADAKCTSRTKAAILMHYAGYLTNRDAWQAFARRKGLLLIEDAAHAPGNVEVGSYGVAAAFSFYGNKNMTTAEGGAVIASDRALLEKIRQMRGHGMTSGTRQRFASRNPNYDVTMLGFNYRMDELRAAVGLAQLKKLNGWNDTRSRLAEHYRRLIAEHCPSVTVPFSQTRSSTHHIMPILLPDAGMRTAVIDQLGDFGVQTTIHYPPVHRLSFLQERCKDTVLPLTEEFARRELTLPLHPRLEGDMVEAIVERLATLVHSPQKILAAE
jgi:dTDP-4-amino-4,6-dideoxygalactose transaminase